MRIMIKGGVWKNTEDEILKAAVMKYGLNQWSRISSLLVRKSAKQCKARWYDWLDPSIKKTEWTREEDEKLLHLAKLMPTQWRTIAPIVGRTPAQCLDRYERLLDMALGKDGAYDPADDPRRLRPGEIDPNPESKPARPDAVDMEEDEKEMLAEARARLANTRGKKAKRKAREKQLEEARRLASLQKKRELKAAGIELRGKDRRMRGINYNAEVAFEKKPVPGFYDTGDEVRHTKEMQQEFRPTTVEEMEGKRRKDLEEALVKKDVKRQKLSEAKNVPGLVERVNDMNSTALRRRTKMMLPAPQVSEIELEAIARMGDAATLEAELAAGAGGEATRQLLGDYQTPARFATPMRTPKAQVGGQDSLMQQAANLAKLRDLQTPLLGGENPELAGLDYSGIVPQKGVVQTPNPLAAAAAAAGVTPGPGYGATPIARGAAGAGGAVGGLLGATPGRAGSIAGVPSTPGALALAGASPGPRGLPGATPARIRDQLGLNEGMTPAAAGYGGAGSLRAQKAAAAALRADLRSSLAELPAPENEYSVAMPELPEEEVDMEIEEDAEDIKARKARAAEEARQAAERKKSKVLQRGLPRPTSIDKLPPPKAPSELAAMSLRERAEAELYAELAALVAHDNSTYPIKVDKDEEKKAKKGKKGRKGEDEDEQQRPQAPAGPPLVQYDLQELETAQQLLSAEIEAVRSAMGHSDVAPEDYYKAWQDTADEFVLDEQGNAVRKASAAPSLRIDALRREYERTRSEMESQAHKAAKLEKKCSILIAGLQQRDSKLRTQVEEVAQQVESAQIELTCFQALQQHEKLVMPDRIERMNLLVQGQHDRELQLQQWFRSLGQQRDDLKESLAQLQQQQAVTVGGGSS